MSATRQVVIEATNLRVIDVEWPGVQPLFELPGVSVMQIHFYSPMLNRWVKLVPERTGDRTAVEVTFEDVRAIQGMADEGGSKIDAVRAVLGFYPGE